MTKRQHLLHILFVLVTTAGSVLIEALSPGGPLAHAEWAAPALGVLAYLMRLLGAVPPAPPTAAALMLLALAVGACGVTGPVPPTGTPGVANCSDAALHQAELDILPAVENALASPGWESALLTIVASVGGPLALTEVSCVVAWVESEADKAAPTTADSLEATKAAHARAWLAAHPVGGSQ